LKENKKAGFSRSNDSLPEFGGKKGYYIKWIKKNAFIEGFYNWIFPRNGTLESLPSSLFIFLKD